MIRCKQCGSKKDIYYIEPLQRVWSVNNIDEDNFVDLHSIEWEFQFKEARAYITCDLCGTSWTLEEYLTLPEYTEPTEEECVS